jgi:hypothetical protein
MKRDLELIRKILLTLEDGAQPKSLADESPERIGYHIQLLLDEHYVEGTVIWDGVGEARTPITYFVRRITNAGHDYLDSVRDPRVWNETKTVLEKVGGGATLEVVKDVAAKVMAELIKRFIGESKAAGSTRGGPGRPAGPEQTLERNPVPPLPHKFASRRATKSPLIVSDAS